MRDQVIRFLERHKIEYRESGANVKKGNININCPYCGDDPSFHMGIEPEKGVYGCWRDVSHRGGNLVTLFMKVTGLPKERVKADLGRIRFVREPALQEREPERPDYSFLDRFSQDFRLISPFANTPAAKPYVRYLQQRFGITGGDLADFAYAYQLRYAVSGPWAGGIIIPVYLHGVLVTLQSRSIWERAQIRYLSLKEDLSRRNIKHCILNYDAVLAHSSARYLVLTEGPFDCFNVDFAGRDLGFRAVGLFNASLHKMQLPLLVGLAKRFERIYIMLDRDAFVQAERMFDELSVYVPSLEIVTWWDSRLAEFDDPGGLSRDALLYLFERLRNAKEKCFNRSR